MSKRLHQLIKNQAQVKVAKQTHATDMEKVWFAALAVVFAGVFYFWGYYFFWGTGWGVLTGD